MNFFNLKIIKFLKFFKYKKPNYMTNTLYLVGIKISISLY